MSNRYRNNYINCCFCFATPASVDVILAALLMLLLLLLLLMLLLLVVVVKVEVFLPTYPPRPGNSHVFSDKLCVDPSQERRYIEVGVSISYLMSL